ncbi:hypothetical protein M5689_017155 [Euphorbia peplus]|nr:hypothetical protein M5689_017155 [Euphorbia peplus]
MAAVLRIIVLFLAFSHLMCVNAIPVTRIDRLMHEHQNDVVQETETEKAMVEIKRMIVQLNDYPGSGANHRHTPWPPQLARSCPDC